MADQWPFTNLVWLPARSGAQAVYLTTGDGVSENGIVVQPGMRGFDAPSFQYSYEESPGLDGAHFNDVRITSREIFIPVMIIGSDRGDFLTKKRAFLSAINPIGSFNAGKLYVTEGDASSRTIDLYYMDGAEGDYGTATGGFVWQKYGLRFVAMDPYFYGAQVETRTWTGDVGELTPFFSSPFFGLNLNKTLSFNGSVTLDVTGDVDSWPIWTVKGPLDSVTFTNNSMGQEFTLTHSLLSGDSITIDTRPGKKTVKHEDGTNLWSNLEPNPQFWPVAPYWNEIEINVTNATSATEITIEYTPRFLSA